MSGLILGSMRSVVEPHVARALAASLANSNVSIKDEAKLKAQFPDLWAKFYPENAAKESAKLAKKNKPKEKRKRSSKPKYVETIMPGLRL